MRLTLVIAHWSWGNIQQKKKYLKPKHLFIQTAWISSETSCRKRVYNVKDGLYGSLKGLWCPDKPLILTEILPKFCKYIYLNMGNKMWVKSIHLIRCEYVWSGFINLIQKYIIGLNFWISSVFLINKFAKYKVPILERGKLLNETRRFPVFNKYIYISYFRSRCNFCYAHFVLSIFNVYMHQ